MQKGISYGEAIAMMTENQISEMNNKIFEVEKVTGLSGFDYFFYFDDVANELFFEIVKDSEVCYRLMFKVKNPVGRPSIGVTKKVSITLSEEDWNQLEKERKKSDLSRSALLRNIIWDYLHFDE